MGDLSFRIVKKDKASRARAGIIKVKHGVIKTPAFSPVATKAVVKTLTSEALSEMGAEILMSNTYHLLLKPSTSHIKKLGGLHRFMNWGGPIITDSAGFQAFSLGYGIEHFTGKFGKYFPEDNPRAKKLQGRPAKKLAWVDDKGVYFKSIYDSTTHRLTPKDSIRAQEELGSDIMIALDECTSPFSDYNYTKLSLERTHRWAVECIKAKKTSQALFGVLQGSEFRDLRQHSAKFIGELAFDGICIGGSLGKSKADMHKILDWVIPHLPESKPRHLLGIGTIEDFFEATSRGVDMFDCVGPTRIARNGYCYIHPSTGGTKENKFRIKITRPEFSGDKAPIDRKCQCRVCKSYSRAYIHHLFKANELTGLRLTSYHNVFFFLQLMREIRKSILQGKFSALKGKWLMRQ